MSFAEEREALPRLQPSPSFPPLQMTQPSVTAPTVKQTSINYKSTCKKSSTRQDKITCILMKKNFNFGDAAQMQPQKKPQHCTLKLVKPYHPNHQWNAWGLSLIRTSPLDSVLQHSRLKNGRMGSQDLQIKGQRTWEKAFMQPVLDYCSQLWSPHLASNIQ